MKRLAVNFPVQTACAFALIAAQQSVQWIGVILRDLQAVFWLRVFPTLKHFPSPPANH